MEEYRDFIISGIPYEGDRAETARVIVEELSKSLNDKYIGANNQEIEFVDIPTRMQPGMCLAFVKFVDPKIHAELVPIINGILAIRNKIVHARLSDNFHKGIRATRFVAWHKDAWKNRHRASRPSSEQASTSRAHSNKEKGDTIDLKEHLRVKRKLEEQKKEYEELKEMSVSLAKNYERRLKEIVEAENEKMALRIKIEEQEATVKQLMRGKEEMQKENKVLARKMQFNQDEIDILRNNTAKARRALDNLNCDPPNE
jgi:hypothetical protein